MPLDITHREREQAGAMKVRMFDISVTDYDATNGEPLTPRMLGMNRIQHVSITPAAGEVFSAGYDRETESILLDVADGEDTEIEIQVFGK